MNFLKISQLVIGTGSVVGGTGAGVYYGVIKNTQEENIEKKDSNAKNQFEGKLVFFKKSGTDSNIKYETKLLNNSEYDSEVNSFNFGKSDDLEKHEKVNKVIEISFPLNIEKTNEELNSIFNKEISLEDIKNKIELEKTKLKDLFGSKIYESLKSKFNS